MVCKKYCLIAGVVAGSNPRDVKTLEWWPGREPGTRKKGRRDRDRDQQRKARQTVKIQSPRGLILVFLFSLLFFSNPLIFTALTLSQVS